jgi:penicillin-binding protein 2
MRVAMLGVAAFILVAIVFFRLWYLQILTGDQYRVVATGNRTRNVSLAAPRGTILDRNGHVLVTSRQATVLQISPNRLPLAERRAAARWGQLAGARENRPKGHHGRPIPYPPPATPQLAAEFARLGKVIGMSPRSIQQTIVNQLVVLPYAAITVKSGSSGQRNYLLERQEFPSIDPPSLGRCATTAQRTGGPASARRTDHQDELKQLSNKGAATDAVIGQTGVEAAFNHCCGVAVSSATRSTRPATLGWGSGLARPQQGDQVQLTIDRGLQTSGQDALAAGAADAATFGNVAAGGAFVALDPRNGQVLAMGSAPTYDPSVFVKGMSFGEYRRLFGTDSGSPQLNRVSSVYPTGRRSNRSRRSRRSAAAR